MMHSNAKAGKSAVRRILFIWAIRNPGKLHRHRLQTYTDKASADLKWISSALVSALAAAPEHLVIEPRIYITRANGAMPSVTYSEDDLSISSDEGEKKKGAETLLSVLRAEAGRPDVNTLLLSEIQGARDGRVSVDGECTCSRCVVFSRGAQSLVPVHWPSPCVPHFAVKHSDLRRF